MLLSKVILMDKKVSESKLYTWLTLLAVVLLLTGIYASIRTAINFVAFDKYPSTGVLSFSFWGPSYGMREQDCNYPMMYWTSDGKTTRPPTKEEKEQENKQKEICLDGVREARESAKVNDISASVLFLALGAGLLRTRRYFAK